MRRFLSLILSLLIVGAVPAHADTRRYSISNFDRIRVEGPFEVRLQTGKAPSGSAVADADTLDRLDIRVDGTTLTIRRNSNGWGETPKSTRRAQPMVITITTLLLRTALVNAGGKLAITGLKGQRADLSINGTGSVAVTGVDTDQFNATIIGTGTMTVAGRSGRAQLLTNGSGVTDARGLQVNDLIVRLDGPGETRAAARFTADVTNTGLGTISVAGNPACTVKAPAGGPVTCGKGSN
jgi:hypothetical protein